MVDASENKVPQAPAVEGRFWHTAGIIMITVAVIILVLLLYIGFNRLIHVNANLAQQIRHLDNKIHQDQTDLTDLQKNLIDMQQNVQQAHEQLETQQAAIDDMRNAQKGKKDVWQVLEAQQLTKLANYHLPVDADSKIAIVLLQNADQVLSQAADPDILPIRHALADDITALQNATTVDVTSTYLQLAALNDQVEKLPLPVNAAADKHAKPAEDTQAKLAWWQRGLQQSLQVMQQLIIVRYHPQGVRPFISPEQQDFLYQNLHALYVQAMSALIHQQSEIYHASLQQISDWIKQYFETDAPAVAATLSDLKKLQSVVIRPELPMPTASLQAFDHYLQAQSDTDASAKVSRS